MQSVLPATGSVKLLERLSSLIPDEFINTSLARRRRPGTKHYFSPAQLWRTHLLAFITPAHSFNAVVRLLPEQRQWRRFAHLSHRHRTPDVRMLHEFRLDAGVTGLRSINDQLVKRLLLTIPRLSKTVAIIDATDLQASTADKKKTKSGLGRRNVPVLGHDHSNRGTHVSSSAIKNIPCGCGCAPTNPPCC